MLSKQILFQSVARTTKKMHFFSLLGEAFRLKWMSAVCKARVPKKRSFGVENLVQSELQLWLKGSKVHRIVLQLLEIFSNVNCPMF